MKLTCGLTTHSYDYIHFNDHKDAYDAMINNPTNEIIKKKKASIDSKVKTMNKSLSKIFSSATGKTSGFFGDTKVDSETGVVRPMPREYLGVTDYNNFVLGESGIAGVENLAVQLLKRPGELNKTINEINNLKTISGQGKMQALRKFISLFGGEIQLLKDGEDVLVGLVPNESFSSNGLQPLSIQKIDEMLATSQAAQGELKLMSDNQEHLKGAAGEISAGLFAAVALKAEKDAYLKIENKGLKKLRETSKFKTNIDTKKFQGMIDQKQKELNRIGSILNKVDADTKLVKIKSTFDQQGKIDVSVGDLNISAKNYWSDNPFELGEMNIAGLMNLVSAYYPKYG